MKKRMLILAGLGVVLATTPTYGADCCNKGGACHSAPAESMPAAVSDKSLYQLEVTWTNDSARPVRLSSLTGRPQVVTMFFAQCQYACPLLVYKMQQLEEALPPNVRTNIGFTLVSFDSKRDTPAALSAYRQQLKLNANWTLLHGNPDEVLEMAALLGVKFKETAQGQFEHSNLITVLNANGELVYQESGLTLQTAELVRQLEKLEPAANAILRPVLGKR